MSWLDEQQILERPVRRLRAEAAQRALVAGIEHPPTGLALVAVLADQHARAISQHEANNSTPGPGVLRRHFDVQTTCLRQVNQDAATRGKAS